MKRYWIAYVALEVLFLGLCWLFVRLSMPFPVLMILGVLATALLFLGALLIFWKGKQS